MEQFEKRRRWSPRTEILAATGLLALGFLLGLGSASWTGLTPHTEEVGSASNMEQAVRSAMKETSAFERSRALGRLFTGLDAENVEAAARGMRTSADFLDPVDLQLFLSAWSDFDPLSAMGVAATWPSEAGRAIGMRIVMREWAASGRVIEAADYYRSLQDPEKRSVVAGPLIRGWALSGDIDGALKQLRAFWDQGDPVNMVDGFVRGALNSVRAEELIEIVMALEPDQGGDFERRLMRVTLNLVARENPIAAAEAYASLEGALPPDWLHGALKVIARPWAEIDSRAAIEWLLERPDRPERTVVLKELMRRWALRDVDAAVGWWTAGVDRAARLGTGNRALRSILLPPLLREMAPLRPVEASRWVEQVEKSVPREMLILRIAYFWASQSPLEAQEWVDGLALSEELSARAAEAIARGAAARGGTDEGANGAFGPDEDSAAPGTNQATE